MVLTLHFKSAYEVGRHFLIKLLILGKIWLYDVTYLTESVPKTLLGGFCALSQGEKIECIQKKSNWWKLRKERVF